MQNQITALFGVFANPKHTMKELPSRQLYVLGVLAPLYFGIARAFRPRNHAVLCEKLGGNVQVVLLVLAAMIYSMFLMIYGYVVSPSEDTPGTSNVPESR